MDIGILGGGSRPHGSLLFLWAMLQDYGPMLTIWGQASLEVTTNSGLTDRVKHQIPSLKRKRSLDPKAQKFNSLNQFTFQRKYVSYFITFGESVKYHKYPHFQGGFLLSYRVNATNLCKCLVGLSHGTNKGNNHFFWQFPVLISQVINPL